MPHIEDGAIAASFLPMTLNQRLSLSILLLAAAVGGIGCEDQCLAVPTCPAGTAEVVSCPDGLTCTEETLCGSTIVCAPVAFDGG